MKRILILGSCGSGKSTFSRNLKHKTGLPIIHLDQHYFGPNWKEKDKDEWKAIVTELAQRQEWIMDGNYMGTLDVRLPHADTIVYLDNSTISNLYRVIKRIIKYYGIQRPDAAPECKERFDFDFLHYVLIFNWVRKPRILEFLYQYKNEKKVVILKGDNERESWLNEQIKSPVN